MGSGHCFGQCHSLNVISMISSFVLNSLYKKRKKNHRRLLKNLYYLPVKREQFIAHQVWQGNMFSFRVLFDFF